MKQNTERSSVDTGHCFEFDNVKYIPVLTFVLDGNWKVCTLICNTIS